MIIYGLSFKKAKYVSFVINSQLLRKYKKIGLSSPISWEKHLIPNQLLKNDIHKLN